MKLNTFFIIFLAVLVFSCPLQAQQNNLHSQEMQTKIKAAIEKVKSDNSTLISDLMKQSPVETLSYLTAYLHDPDPHVRHAVLSAASDQRTEAAFAVFAESVSDPVDYVANGGVARLYRNFDNQTIASAGGQRLKRGLIQMLPRQGNVADFVLLLSCFTRDAEAKRALEQARTGRKTEKMILVGGGPDVEFSVIADVALANWGDAAATARVGQLINSGSANNKAFILQALRFVNNPTLLQSALTLLDDTAKTSIHYGGIHDSLGTNAAPVFLRVCDVALVALAKKTGADVGVPDVMRLLKLQLGFDPNRIFTGDELKTARAKLALALSPKQSRRN